MNLEEAMAIVYDLAVENALPERDDPPLSQEAKRQKKALAVVHELMFVLFMKGG